MADLLAMTESNDPFRRGEPWRTVSDCARFLIGKRPHPYYSGFPHTQTRRLCTFTPGCTLSASWLQGLVICAGRSISGFTAIVVGGVGCGGRAIMTEDLPGLALRR